MSSNKDKFICTVYVLQFDGTNGSDVTFNAFYGKSHETWTLPAANNLSSAVIRICLDSDAAGVTQNRSVQLIANSGDRPVTVSINVTLMDSIDLKIDAETVETNVTLLSPLTLIAQKSDAGSSLVLKMDDADEETANVCMMITVQVCCYFLSR